MVTKENCLEIIGDIASTILEMIDEEHKKSGCSKDHDSSYFHIRNKINTIIGITSDAYDEFDYNNILDMEKKSNGEVK